MELIIKDAALDLLAGLQVDEGSARVEREHSDETSEHYRVMISSSDASRLIGRRGETLQSFQHLLKLVVGKKAKEKEYDRRLNLTVDVDGYRDRQVEKKVDLAGRLAERVLDTGRPEELRPMSSFLRRGVHLYIAEKYPELTTESVGHGAEKVLVIKKNPEWKGDAAAESVES